MNENVTLVVVTPVYEDKEASSLLFLELKKEIGDCLYIVAVDDGSVSSSLDSSEIEDAGAKGLVIKLKRNVGHQRAIAVGLSYVSQNFPDANCVVMDSDGEDLPSSIKELISKLDSSLVDVVVAQRKRRVETLKFKIFYVVYRFLFKIMTGRRINFGNFMALKPTAVNRIVVMQELWIHIAACVLNSKLRVVLCPLDRGPRYAGQSKMNFVGLALHGFRAFMAYTEDVLVRVGIACAAIGFLSLVGIAISIMLKFSGLATPGWFSVALGVLVLVLLQTGTLTLMSLLLTGIVRSGNMLSIDYRDLVDKVIVANEKNSV